MIIDVGVVLLFRKIGIKLSGSFMYLGLEKCERKGLGVGKYWILGQSGEKCFQIFSPIPNPIR
jgi:hypothetical protein